MHDKNTLGIIFFPAFDWRISPTHPEREERLLYTLDQIKEEGLEDLKNVTFFNPSVATVKDIKRAHFIYPSVESILTDSHFISAGAAIRAAELVLNKDVNKAFSLTRPPGHHAQTVVYGDRGFCVVNNEAVMVEYIRHKYPNLKIAIIDTDCHHGDGTEDIFYNDKNVLVINIHQDPRTLYPGTGRIHELGSPNAFGYNINVPLPPNTGDEGYLYVIKNLVLPILKDFQPDLIINSAGQDNHYSDPLTNMNLSARGYAKLNELLNPDILVLEGGYSIEGALPYVNVAIILAMIGEDYSHVIEPNFAEDKIRQSTKVTSYIKELTSEILALWQNKAKLKAKLYPPQEVYSVKRTVYYDTSNIREEQTRDYYACQTCNGIHTITSKNDRGAHIFAVTIPFNSCAKCLKQGKDTYNGASNKEFSKVYLQNKKEDIYLEK